MSPVGCCRCCNAIHRLVVHIHMQRCKKKREEGERTTRDRVLRVGLRCRLGQKRRFLFFWQRKKMSREIR